MDKVKWLHISDIHYTYKGYETKQMRKKMLEFIKTLEINFLVITGDLLYKFEGGFTEELQEFITEIISNTSVKIENVFIVPGNHDFKRDDMRAYAIEGIIGDKKKIDENINSLNEGTLKGLIDGQREFWDFHKLFLKRDGDYFYDLHFIEKRDKFNIINLNTCLISGRKDEEGELSIHLNKLSEVLEELTDDDDKLNIAIGHHTLECFNSKEQEEIIQLFNTYNVDIYICGHTHKTKTKTYLEGERDIICLICGSGFSDSENYAIPTLISGEFNLFTAELNVKYFSWKSRVKKWNIDLDVSSRAKADGCIEFDIERLKKNETNLNNEFDLNAEIEELIGDTIEIDEFERFLVHFSKIIKDAKDPKSPHKKDVEEKFVNMKCNNTFQRDFAKCSAYFPSIKKILSDTAYRDFDRSHYIPGVVSDIYSRVIDTAVSGNDVMNKMIDIFLDDYYEIFASKNSKRQMRCIFRTIICWSLYECDIYNEQLV